MKYDLKYCLTPSILVDAYHLFPADMCDTYFSRVSADSDAYHYASSACGSDLQSNGTFVM